MKGLGRKNTSFQKTMGIEGLGLKNNFTEWLGRPNIGGTLGVPTNKDYSMVGSILGSPYLGKLPVKTTQSCLE